MTGILTYLRNNMGRSAAMLAAVIACFIYIISVDSSVSYWDCPEYVLTASTLQVGHPPGNPIWTLAMRVATIPFPKSLHALVINLCSSVFLALAVFFLARIICRFICYVLPDKLSRQYSETLAAIVSFFSSLSFAVLDSTWYSAVEAEVYAFSTFLTALTIWLMLKWREATSSASRSRWLILTAYMLGLSLGVHQLNLLVIPVLALIFVFGRNPHTNAILKAWVAIPVSFLVVALVLIGLMPGAVEWAAQLELLCVNRFDLPYFTGTLLYPLIFSAVAVMSVSFIPRGSRVMRFIFLSSLLWLSGLFLFHSHIVIALVQSIITAFILLNIISTRAILTSAWMLIMIWTGYSAISLILIRGYASPPINESAPADIFSFQRYISREQYGSQPLFIGSTPFSRPMLEERIDPLSGKADYSRYALRKENPRYIPVMASPRLAYRSRMLTHSDSALNRDMTDRNHGYLLADYRFSRRMTPELDMLLPRITSGNRNMMAAYADWAGMTEDNMERVEISTAYDSTGKAVGKLLPSGEREIAYAKRPTYVQNLRYFLSYQTYYMYLRYLLWNFVGRQNDIPATGEIDHGNVITGFKFLDRMMTGDERLMPRDAAYENPGRHAYFAIPFLIGIAGMVWLLRRGKRGKRIMAVVTMLFLMTGVAIVVYLNQTPGEPRERDYAFIASYMAFCIWIAFGLIALAEGAARCIRSRRATLPVAASCGAILFLWYLIENYPDHNRSGRFHTRAFALNTLAGKERDIVFSYGDNFTFPLWYAREVENVAPDATVVDLSYLATPEYVVNLMKQGKNGLRLTATPADIAYGALSFTPIAPDADTVPRPLIDILRAFYASPESTPALAHTRATIPGYTSSDTITINLRSLATVAGMIPFRTLMLLDIIATNLEQPDPRPVSFLSSVKSEVFSPLKGALRIEAFSDTYAPFMSQDEYSRRLLISANAIDSTARHHAGEKIYTDPVINDQIRRQRGALVRVASQLAKIVDDSVTARKLLNRFPHLYPGVSSGYYSVADTAFHETITAARLLLSYGHKDDVQTAMGLLMDALSRGTAWRRYYNSLPDWRRHTVSNESRHLINTTIIIDSLMKSNNIEEERLKSKQ